jgi:hypothetical protein
MRAVLSICGLLFIAPPVVGETEIPDFSEGLRRIAALGLPEMKDAKWVKLPESRGERFTSSYEFTEMSIKTSGNTWQLSTDPPTYLDFGSGEFIDPPADGNKKAQADEPSGAKSGVLGKMLKNFKEKNPEPEKEPKTTEPKEVVSLAAKDATKIASALAKPAVAESLNDNIRWGYTNTHGRLMLFAAQLQAAGETESANTLAAALFLAATDDSALIDGAISHLADAEYAAIAARFFENNDWKTYQKGLVALLEKFPRGWSKGPAIALLASNLEKRTTPPKPSLDGIKLNPKAIALLDELLEKADSKTSDEDLAKANGYNLSQFPPSQRASIVAMLRAQGMGSFTNNQDLWILQSKEANAASDNSSTLSKIKAMGMDGLIALAAVAEDQTLLPIPNPQNERNFYGGSESMAEAILRNYQNLNRPVSRGEIAVAILSSVIPIPSSDPYSRSSQPDPAEISASAIDFWKKHKDKSPVQLATVYITEGNPYQQSTASSFLASSKDPAAHAAFEKTVLASGDPISLIGQVDQYLTARKAKAKDFANAYIKLLRDNPPGEQELMRSAAGYHIREAGGLENYLKRLSLKVGDASLDKMIRDALKAKPEKTAERDPYSQPNTPIAALGSTVQSIPINECFVAFGKVANQASPEQWMEIHQLLLGRITSELRARYNSMEEDEDEAGDDEKAPAFAALPEEVMSLWKPFMARTEALPTEGQFPTYASAYGAKTIGDATTLLLELAVSPQIVYSLNQFAQLEGSSDAIMDIARKRVAAWSTGETPEPWPDAGNVSNERKEEISAKLAKLRADEIIPFAKSLNRDERLALAYINYQYEDEESVPTALTELRQIIVTTTPVFTADFDADAAAKLGIAQGERITAEFLTKIIRNLLKDPTANSTTTVTFFPAAMNLGSSLFVTTAKDLSPTKTQSSGLAYLASSFQKHEEADALAFIAVGRATDIFTLKDDKAVALETETSGLEEFKKALETKSPSLPYIRISILSRQDAEKIISNQEE